jgi:DNA modification methylase
VNVRNHSFSLEEGFLDNSNYLYQTDAILQNLLREYNVTQLPIPVNFRKLVNCFSSAERSTHLIHSYPAKLLMHIPFFFLANQRLSKPDDTVLDPFAGSGTVLLESLLSGRNALGAECNPLARLIARVKTTPLDVSEIESTSSTIFEGATSNPKHPIPDVININHWFYPHVIEHLHSIVEKIASIADISIREFFLVCLSQCVRKVSLADPRLSTPVRLKEEYPNGHRMRERAEKQLSYLKTVSAHDVFKDILSANTRRIATLEPLQNSPLERKVNVLCSDARKLHYEYPASDQSPSLLPNDSVQLVITSPPYPGAQKYVRCSSLSLGWLGLCPSNGFIELKSQTIGREEYRLSDCSQPVETGISEADNLLSEIWNDNPIRATIAGKYLSEMRDALLEMHRVLRPNGYLVLVAANNHVCKREFRTLNYLRCIAESIGFSTVLELVDHIRSRGLMTKRNHTASMITREGILVFGKGG